MCPGVMGWIGVNGCFGETDRRIHPARVAGGGPCGEDAWKVA